MVAKRLSSFARTWVTYVLATALRTTGTSSGLRVLQPRVKICVPRLCAPRKSISSSVAASSILNIFFSSRKDELLLHSVFCTSSLARAILILSRLIMRATSVCDKRITASSVPKSSAFSALASLSWLRISKNTVPLHT